MKIPILLIVILTALYISACGNGGADGERSGVGADGLTEFQLEHGIGPVTEPVSLVEIDDDLVDKGRSIFQSKCAACHQMENRLVGPALGVVMERRSPAFVMNFILNPSGMIRDHPEGQRLLEEYRAPMPYQNETREEARALVEYLRTYAEN